MRNPLSFEKLISFFFIIGIGVVSALIVMVYEKFSYSEKEKARMIVQREENMKDFIMTVKELHNCIKMNEWPDKKLLRSFYQTSQNIM